MVEANAHAASHNAAHAATGAPDRGDPEGGVFAFRATVFDADDLRRAHTRIAHEIVERNHGADDVVLAGLYTRGVAIAHRLAAAIAEFESAEVPVGVLDVAFYRDDIGLRPVQPLGPTDIPVDVTGKVVVLVDDVLYTGRTVRAALDALHELGRPRAVQLAILVDRGHRELPIRPDFVGKNLPTQAGDDVRVRLVETDDVAADSVQLWAAPDVRSGTDPDVRSGTDPDVRSGTDPDVRSGTDPDVRSGTDPDVRSGTDPDVRSGTDPDVRSATEPAASADEGGAP